MKLKICLAICSIFWLLQMSSCLENSSNLPDSPIKSIGTLRNIMKQGDLSAKIDISQLQKTKHLYALGAVENLKGEIQIIAGHAFTSRVENGEVLIDTSWNHRAALLVYTQVSVWDTLSLPEEIKSHKALEKFLGKAQRELYGNPKTPFVFILKGKPRECFWHVIDWPTGKNDHTHRQHVESGLSGVLEDSYLEIIGFYSESHQGIWTHRNAKIHMHVFSAESQIAGHVDLLTPGSDMVLLLPEQNEEQ